ncbi:uncharacterized protein LOC121375364 [Gigantopelta aegis]|uniref:uncharacterized protein LOC121375364 n=1 Tax=Gigantopelta aegis TaxID=1735272 RepID=UPI001B887415|nr:uncharacterized protein LOC121375364 [Gigantopelta aegis]
MSKSMSTEHKSDVVAEARNFSASLANVFLMKKRDPQTRHLLEKAQHFVDGLLAENQRLTNSAGTPRHSRSGGMGQLWVKLDEMKRENEELRKHVGRGQHEDRGTPTKSIGQGSSDTTKVDLQRARTEIESLKQQNEKLQKTEKELVVITAGLQDECKRLKTALDVAHKSVEKAKREFKNLEASLTTAKTENDSLKQKVTSSVKPMVRTDNRHTENINERCRPSVIAVQYNTMESQVWVDAKETLEDSTGQDEEDIARFLCAALMTSYETSLDVYRHLELAIAELLRNPTMAMTITRDSTRDLPQLPDEMTDAMRLRLRQTFDHVDTDSFMEIVQHSLGAEFKDHVKYIPRHKSVSEFLKQSARLTWQMVIQQPPMKLCTHDTTFDDEKHKLWWSCDQSRAKTIDYFIWPILKDYDNGTIMVKGCVYAS